MHYVDKPFPSHKRVIIGCEKRVTVESDLTRAGGGGDASYHRLPAGQHAVACGSGYGTRHDAGEVYAALDIGTNNCRLLVAVCDTDDAAGLPDGARAAPTAKHPLFRVIDAFSRRTQKDR